MSSGNNKEIEDWSHYDEEDGDNNYGDNNSGYYKKKVRNRSGVFRYVQ
jgi:hypothetical protein